MNPPDIVDRNTWREARKLLLAKEKAFTQAQDALTAERQKMPWVRIDADYRFDTPNGQQSLAGLFGGKSQLIIQHFMLGEGWKAGCPSCSFWADGYDGIDVHLAARDIAFVTVSNAPLAEIEAFRQRMGWNIVWVSAFGSSFNQDFHVSFSGNTDSGVEYNYQRQRFSMSEAPGISVFAKAPDGQICHTYSCYARGLDMMNAAYHYMDLTPKGRDEADLPYTMAWLKRHDEYD